MNSLELSWMVSHHFVLFSFALDEGREKKKKKVLQLCQFPSFALPPKQTCCELSVANTYSRNSSFVQSWNKGGPYKD